MNAGYVNNAWSSPKVDLAGTSAAFLFQVGVTGICVALFVILRTNNKRLYSPRLKFADIEKRPKPLEGGLFGWVKVVMRQNELQMVNQIGVDAVLYISFLKLIRTLLFELIFIAIPLCIFHINGAQWTGGKNSFDSKKADKIRYNNETLSISLTSMTISKVYTNSNWFWLHAIFTWIVTFIVFHRLYKFWLLWIDLRTKYFFSDAFLRSPHNRTLLVRHVPREMDNDSEMLKSLSPDLNPQAILLNRDLGQLPKLVNLHKKYNNKMEVTLNRYLGRPNNISKRRPTCRIKNTDGKINTLPQKIKSIFKLGTKQDKIEAYSNIINSLESDIYSLRSKKDEDFSFNGSAFLAFDSANEAHNALKTINDNKKFLFKNWHIYLPTAQLSPCFNEIYWENLGMPFYGFLLRKLITFLIYLGMIIFWIFFLCIIVTLLSWKMLIKLSPKVLGKFVTENIYALMFLQYVLAPSILAIIQILPPYILFYLSKIGGGISRTEVSQKAMNKFFIFAIFQIVTMFVSQTLLAGLQRKILGIDKTISVTFKTSISIDLINMSSFFVTYIGTGLIGQSMELIQIGSLILYAFRRIFRSNTPRKEHKFKRIPQPMISTFYAQNLFMFLISFVYTLVAPMMIVSGLILFSVAYIVMKHQFLYVYELRADTGGSYWPKVFRLLMLIVFLFQLVTFIGIRVIGVSLQNSANNSINHPANNDVPAFIALSSILSTLGFYYYITYYVKPNGEFKMQGKNLQYSSSESTHLLNESVNSSSSPIPMPSDSLTYTINKSTHGLSIDYEDDNKNLNNGNSNNSNGDCNKFALKNDVWEGLYDPALIDPLQKIWIWRRSEHLLDEYHTYTYLGISDYFSKTNELNNPISSYNNNFKTSTLNRHVTNYISYRDMQLLNNRALKLAYLINKKQKSLDIIEINRKNKLKNNKNNSPSSDLDLSHIESQSVLGRKQKKEYDTSPEIRRVLNQVNLNKKTDFSSNSRVINNSNYKSFLNDDSILEII